VTKAVRNLCLVLGDQLSFDLASLGGLDSQHDAVLMVEVMEEASHVPHHPQKIALVFSAMRHFAQALQQRGIRVQYVALDDPQNTGSVPGELGRWQSLMQPQALHLTECGDWRLEQSLKDCGLPIQWHADSRFLCSRDEFATWASGKKQLRMEFFYREMRRKSGLLLNGDGTPGTLMQTTARRCPREPRRPTRRASVQTPSPRTCWRWYVNTSAATTANWTPSITR
jgi:deoxyribodipyrimidine photolyase-related protein